MVPFEKWCRGSCRSQALNGRAASSIGSIMGRYMDTPWSDTTTRPAKAITATSAVAKTLTSSAALKPWSPIFFGTMKCAEAQTHEKELSLH